MVPKGLGSYSRWIVKGSSLLAEGACSDGVRGLIDASPDAPFLFTIRSQQRFLQWQGPFLVGGTRQTDA